MYMNSRQLYEFVSLLSIADTVTLNELGVGNCNNE